MAARPCAAIAGLVGKNDRIDHANDTICGVDVRGDDSRIVDADVAINNLYRNVRTLHCGRFRQVDHVLSHYLAGHDVIRQHGDQLITILGLQQVLDGNLRQL